MENEQVYNIIKESITNKDTRGHWLLTAILAMSNKNIDSKIVGLAINNIVSNTHKHRTINQYKSISKKAEKLRSDILGLSQMTITMPEKNKKRNKKSDPYYVQVWQQTELSAPFLKDIHLRGWKQKHIEHIVPISYGLKHNIPPCLIGSIDNLIMLDRKDNMIKGRKLTKDSIKLLKKWGYELP
jgi:hypothetical protein